ncbi:50S ribosomal protein L19 [uncultured Duncaniella sp.]|uniref:50S ribosomal protein L19 n=1 Tax=uncultured Duncaniella sp. TaxID=2768039 RepID=UPI00261ED236|nr:50S ribosomal protein L19 [uncultured Duncaniella sp.]
MDLIKVAEEAFATGKQHPEFGPGDTITVAYRIKEGNKERIQQYRGVVIRISGEGSKKRFTVRKMSDNIGVERIFPSEFHPNRQIIRPARADFLLQPIAIFSNFADIKLT